MKFKLSDPSESISGNCGCTTDSASSIFSGGLNNCSPANSISWNDIVDKPTCFPACSDSIGITGEMRMYGGTSSPIGWLFCDGSEISRSTYTNLFSVIGVAFGVGNGTTTFGIPDFRGRVPMGVGHGTGLTNRTIGQKPGLESYIDTHTHTLDDLVIDDHNVDIDITGTVTINSYTGSVTPTVTITVAAIPYTLNPTGTVTINSITPGGSIIINPNTAIGTVSLSAYTPAGTISIASFTPLGSITINSLTPSGTVTLSTWAPVGTISINNATATGSVTLSSWTPTGTITVNNTTAGGTVTLSAYTPAGTISLSAYTPSGTISINNHTDVISEAAPGHHHSVTIPQILVGNEVGTTAVALPGTYTTTDRVVSITLNLAHSGTFTGSASGQTATFTGTASGQTASFSGTPHNHTATFAGDASTQTATVSINPHTHTGTFTGTNSTQTASFSGNSVTPTGTFTGASTSTTGTFTGTLSTQTASFSGVAHNHTGTFTGAPVTPTGTISINTLTGNLHTTATGVVSAVSLNHGHTGSISMNTYNLVLSHTVSGTVDPKALTIVTIQPSLVVNFIIKY